MSNKLMAHVPELTAPADQFLIAAACSGEITTQLDNEQLLRLEDEIDQAVEAVRKAQQSIRDLCGPAPGIVPARLLVILQMGAGYSVTARDLIRALWRAKNTANRRDLEP